MSRTDKDRLAGGGGPPRWFIKHVWTGAERQAARIDCRTAAKEYRGSGAVEIVPATAQHRHNAQWLWW